MRRNLSRLWSIIRRVNRRLQVLEAAFASASLLACNGKVTRQQCTEMLDKYLDMTIASEPDLADLPPSEARAAREMKRALRKSEPSYARVQNQCESEIRKSEYRCAMKAPTPEMWQACID
jgi:hypothetical protein